jgi:acyl-coenzyme A synthetase/AMP-(fatty) acid ligase
LHDFASGRCWTFQELFAAGQKREIAPAGPVFPQGHSPEFVLDLLAAWRENRLACPLEAGQAPLEIATPPKNCVHLKSTSATGGAARFVAFTAEQLAADVENIVATMGLRPDWPNLGVTSLAHSYGFSNLVLPLLLHGIPLILAPAPLPEILRRATATIPAVTLPAVPAMWRAWHEAGAIPTNVRLAISAGAPLPLNLEQEIFSSCGLKLHNFLGSSECGGIAYDASDAPRADAALAGAPMQSVNLSLDENGCLVVRSRAVAETYWPEKSDSLGDGIFQTNDLAELRDGAVFLRGRLGDQINVAGRKVSPETIERALLGHPRVRECLVFGAPSRDVERTEIIVAVVAADAAESELKQFLLQTLPAWQVPREWHFVDSLSVNARGKISRAEWRRRHSSRI